MYMLQLCFIGYIILRFCVHLLSGHWACVQQSSWPVVLAQTWAILCSIGGTVPMGCSTAGMYTVSQKNDTV